MYYYKPKISEKEFISDKISIIYSEKEDYYKIISNTFIPKNQLIMIEKSDINLFGFIKSDNIFDMLYLIIKNSENVNIKNLYPRKFIYLKKNDYIFDLKKELKKYKNEKNKKFLQNVDDETLYLHYYKYLFNAFQIYDSSIILFKGSMMNHSIKPNIKFYPVNDSMYFETITNIKKGDELTFSYLRNVTLSDQTEIDKYLMDHYNF
jgi:hypothetical protein